MKKIILLLLFVLVGISASARKSYITMTTDNFMTGSTVYKGYIYLSGEVPENIENKGFIYDTYYHYWKVNYSEGSGIKYTTSEILNWLSEYGYEVEFMDDSGYKFLLSKEISSGQSISKGDVNEDSEVNIADVNEVISLILGIVREHPEILKQIKD